MLSDPFSSWQFGKKKNLKKEIEFTERECSVLEKRFLIVDNEKNSSFSKEHNSKGKLAYFGKRTEFFH